MEHLETFMDDFELLKFRNSPMVSHENAAH